ncbi:recombination protein RecR [bacterium]|nr:recombination protein RecR [bacterium]
MLPEALNQLVQLLSQLPGLGPRSAQRIALYLLEQDESYLKQLAESIGTAKEMVETCPRCGGFSSSGMCAFCTDKSRDSALLCVVADPLDIYPIESTGGFNGYYFVLGGLVDPLKGRMLESLRTPELKARLGEGEVKEVLLALDFSFEGEATATVLVEELGAEGVKFTRLARGLPVGAEIDYADEDTLGQALKYRREIEPIGDQPDE